MIGMFLKFAPETHTMLKQCEATTSEMSRKASPPAAIYGIRQDVNNAHCCSGELYCTSECSMYANAVACMIASQSGFHSKHLAPMLHLFVVFVSV